MRLIVLLLFCWSTSLLAQEQKEVDSLRKGRVIGISSAVGAGWSGSMIGLAQVWYKGVEKTRWHTFNDCGNWLQMDKAGHMYTANKIASLTNNWYEWAGLTNKQSAWLGFGISVGYQSTLEMLDAYSADWGFSWCDFGANIAGASLFLGQELGWEEQKILMKFSYRHSPYAALRPNVLGSNFPERLLKDYNGQTYWLSVSPGQFIERPYLPKWLCVSVGYGATAKIIGDKETYVHTEGNVSTLYRSSRQLFCSLDIDFTQFNIRRKWLRTIIHQFNYLKVPFPAIYVQRSGVGVNWLGW